MKKRVTFNPYVQCDNASLSNTDGHIELFCVGFKLQDYLNTCPTSDQQDFMRKAETIFERYRSISPSCHINPTEGVKLIENIRIGTISGASEFARTLTPHPFLRDAFLKLYP
jgi:hypothetical protein